MKDKNIYIRPYEVGLKLYLLSFAPSYKSDDMVVSRTSTADMFAGHDVGGIVCKNLVSYPIISVALEPTHTSDGEIKSYTEFEHYIFKYDENILWFKPSVLENFVGG